MATIHGPSSRFVREGYAAAVLAGLAVFALLGLSQANPSRTESAAVCEARRQAYERSIEKLSRSAAANEAGEDALDQLIEARQKAFANYCECLKQAGESGAVILSDPPPTWARPPITPPASRGTPPFPPPRGTPRFTPGTPQGPPLTPPVTRGRPPFTPPGPPMTPPGPTMTPPGPPLTPPGPPLTPPGPPLTPPGPPLTPPGPPLTPPGHG